LHRPVLLLVDDTPQNLTVLGEILRNDYRVRAVTSGARALAAAASPPRPDLILLDVMMPEMDGWEVLAALRAEPLTRDIPVIFVTALAEAVDEERGLAAGAVDYIAKPYRAQVVLARVRTQLELKRVRDLLADHNAFLESEVARRVADLARAEEATIHALARLAETRDPETGNHLLRTQNYMRTLGEVLAPHPRFAASLDRRSIDLIARSATLHDIGKVGIPDHILLKPGPLTADEWAIMKTHAALGAEAMERVEHDVSGPIEFLVHGKQIARHHHERWSGGGYPDGLAGEAIPLAARMMAVADVFDALISRRPYKAPVPLPRVNEMLARERGRHFDPDVLDGFLAAWDRMTDIAVRFGDPENEHGAPAADAPR
jgi:putative two-component system response regulator